MPDDMSSPDKIRFGKKIRDLRLTKGWTQEELAAHTGLHPTYIGGVERGERNLGFDNILKLARALDERPSELFADFSK
jgi:transcriptional regulator with XRE-family HTH domain